MDGAQEVQRNRAVRAVSAKVDTGVRRRVSFGEPEDSVPFESKAAILRRVRWTKRYADWFAPEPSLEDVVRVNSAFGQRYRLVAVRASGQTVVELALLMPLLLVLLLGVIEIGRYAYFDILVSNAARAGAQYGAQSLIQAADIAGIQQAAHNDGLAAMTITTQQQCGCSSGALGGCPTGGVCPVPLVYVQVTATDTYSSLFNFRWLPIPTQMTLTSTVTMRVSQ